MRQSQPGTRFSASLGTDANWGETAKAITGGEGAHIVVDVGGESTVRQSLLAVRIEGLVALIGFLGGTEKPENAVGFAECFAAMAIMRSVEVGSREQFEEMNRYA